MGGLGGDGRPEKATHKAVQSGVLLVPEGIVSAEA